MIFPGDTIGARIFPADLGRYVSSYYEKKCIPRITESGHS
jgi:hypothetical protein